MALGLDPVADRIYPSGAKETEAMSASGTNGGDSDPTSMGGITMFGLYEPPTNGATSPRSAPLADGPLAPTAPGVACSPPEVALTVPGVVPRDGSGVSEVLRLAPRRERFACPGVEPYLTVNEVCANYAIDRSTLYRWLKDSESGLDEIAVRNPGHGRWRFPADRFREWFDGANRRRGRRGGRDAE